MVQPGRIGKYAIGHRLGHGAFGILYAAQDTELGREVALKILRPEHAFRQQVVQRFLQEARAAARVNHPGIVTVFESGQVAEGEGEGTTYIAMELLDGETLGARIKRQGRMPSGEAIRITRQIAAALAAAHQAGIIHRDLKPQNIFLVPDSAVLGGERVKVLDFGIAKLADDFGDGIQTHSMLVLGTPRYMSPEQCKSSAKVDVRSDVYSLGCILFELVCGQPPFDGDAGELIAKQQLVPPPETRSLGAELPSMVDKLVVSMLAKNPDERPQTMTAVLDALDECDNDAAEPATTPEATRLPSEPAAEATTPYNKALTDLAPEPATTPRGIRLSTEPTAPTVDRLPQDDGTGSTLGEAAASSVRIEPATPTRRKTLMIMSGAAIAVGVIAAISLGREDGKPTASAASDTTTTTVAAATVVAVDAMAETTQEVAPEPLPTAEPATPSKDKVKGKSVAKTGRDADTLDDCDVPSLQRNGEDLAELGHHDDALVELDTAFHCKPDKQLARLAFMAACNSSNADKARFYFHHLTPADRAKYKQICVRNGLPVDCDPGQLTNEGLELVNKGKQQAALAKFEASLACKVDAHVTSLAFMTSCNAGNAAKARKYYAQLAEDQRTKYRIMCDRQKVPLE